MKVLVLALSRSGHHAFINWLCSNLEGENHFYNNCVLGWEEGKLERYNKNNKSHQIYYNGNNINEIYSIETFNPDDFLKLPIQSVGIDKIILFIRDFYNWVASCYKGGGEGKHQLTNSFINQRNEQKPNTIELWKKQVNWALQNNGEILDVSYPYWLLDLNYRNALADSLSFKNNEKGLKEISNFGGGSSFYGIKSINDPCSRWKLFDKEDDYWKIVNDNEAIRLNNIYMNV